MASPRPFVLITGAGRGIGAAVALACARAGWDLGLNYRQDHAAAESVAQTARALGAQARLLPADVADEAQVEALFAALDAQGQRIDALVNNAGVIDARMRLDAMSAERMRRIFNTNVVGTMVCAREAVRRMSTAHGGAGGAIVNLSSVAAKLGSPGWYCDYAASKAAIDAFTLGLAREVALEGVRVNAVRPGIIATDIHASGGVGDIEAIAKPLIPMQRLGTADEVAQAVLWLMSPAASYATGAILDVSGGR